MKIILASASPRRSELLKQIGWEFEICVSDVEEKITGVLPQEVVEELSLQKAEDVAGKIGQEGCTDVCNVLIIGADTVVACERAFGDRERILGKPADREDAAAMIRLLQGRSHWVYTGVTLILLQPDGKQKLRTFHEATKVTFYPMTEAEIKSYTDSDEPAGKAGSYAIQGLCARYISGIEGDYNNVVGLPVGRVYQEVKALLCETGE